MVSVVVEFFYVLKGLYERLLSDYYEMSFSAVSLSFSTEVNLWFFFTYLSIFVFDVYSIKESASKFWRECYMKLKDVFLFRGVRVFKFGPT